VHLNAQLTGLWRPPTRACAWFLTIALFVLWGISPAAADATNGILTTAFVTDGLCMAGPYKNNDSAPLSVTYGGDASVSGEYIFLFHWSEADQWGYYSNRVTPPAGSTWISETVVVASGGRYLVGNTLYSYLYGQFTDAGDGRSDGQSPLLPPNLPAGSTGAYHQTATDMSQDPDCVPRATSVALTASSSSSAPDQEVTFTATVSPTTATGNIIFLVDGIAQTPVALSAGSATYRASTLTTGDHQIIARYDGDTQHDASVSTTLSHTVLAVGTVLIRQETDGPDAVFPFTSPTAALNLSIATSGGRGESAPISLPAGTYIVTAGDMSSAGFAVTGLTCSDGNSSTSIGERSATLVLDAGEALICTFTAMQSQAKTVQLIEDFLAARAKLILANQPDIQRRIDRLSGLTTGDGNPLTPLMSYLSGLAEGRPVNVSGSLAAINRLAGNEAPSAFDAWIEGTFASLDARSSNSNFNSFSAGADYLVSPDLLIGGFIQMDNLSQRSITSAATASGTGWLAGPYATMRLSDNLFLDVLAGAGTSSNQLRPYGSYQDQFDAMRWLVSATLQGQWQWDNWTFSPRARFSYFEETTRPYIDSLGIEIPATTVGLGQLTIGPAISYRYVTEGEIIIDTGLRLEGIADIFRATNDIGLDKFRIGVEGTIGLSFPGGAKLGLAVGRTGLGGEESVTRATIKASVALN